MDRNTIAIATHPQDFDVADRERLATFKLGATAPSASRRPRSLHVQSHTRKNSSVSVLPSSTSLSFTSSFSLTDSPPASPPPNVGTSSKRNSHHRRRSSVSTRHESAELMGVSLPPLPSSTSDDSLNFSDKDFVRRRALWALEGRTDVGSFSKVEIPELDTSEVKKPFDFLSKPPYQSAAGAGLPSIMSGKRDSIGKFAPSASSKEQLHTLVEEEEEEEDNVLDVTVASLPVEEVSAPPEALSALATSPVPAPVRSRPAALNLRPLSLTLSVTPQDTRADPVTPSPSLGTSNPRPGLKALALIASANCGLSKAVPADGVPSKRQSMTITPSSVPPPSSGSFDSPDLVQTATRRSSISYFPCESFREVPSHGLPTPEMTPVSDCRYSASSTNSDASRQSTSSRSLSVSEQHFLFQAHQTLVQRISDLERALSARPPSRPQSCASDTSPQSETVNDEMLQLIADLKTERDELKRDVDGWRTRLNDCEKQMSLLFKRIENGRREAWVARERVGLMEAEKRSIEQALYDKTLWGEQGWQKFSTAQAELESLQADCENLRVAVRKATEDAEECTRLRMALEEERKRSEGLEKELELAGLLATPTPQAFGFHSALISTASRTMMFAKRGGLGFRSADSVSSMTDVESVGSVDYVKSHLKVVKEEDEGDNRDEVTSECSLEDNGLAGYEDEDADDCFVFHSSSVSSLASVDALPTAIVDTSGDSVPPLSRSRSSSASPIPITSQFSHGRRASLSTNWTFPNDTVNPPFNSGPEAEIDRFFNCLEDLDDSPPLDHILQGHGKNVFSCALADETDELPPFVLPSGFGVEVDSPDMDSRTVLDALVEEDELEEPSEAANDEFIGEKDEGGIIFTFGPPPSFTEEANELTSEPTVPIPEDSDTPDSSTCSTPRTPLTSPSSIPRLATSKRSAASPTFSTPVKASRNLHDSLHFEVPPTLPMKGVKSLASSRAVASVPNGASTPPKPSQPLFLPQPRPNQPSAVSRIPISTGHISKRVLSISDSQLSEVNSDSSRVSADSPTIPTLASPHRDPSPSPLSPARRHIQKLTDLVSLPSLASFSPLPSTFSLYSIFDSPDTSSRTQVMCGSALAENHDCFLPSTQRKLTSRQSQLEKLKLRLAEECLQQSRAFQERTAIRNVQGDVVYL